MNKKIYIASGLKNYKRVIELRDKLEEYGIWLTYDWAQVVKDNKDSNVEESKNDWQGIASAEYIGVVDADAFLFVCPAGRGGHFELGVAYSKNVPIILLEDEDPIAFYHLPDIERYSDEDEAIERLLEILS